MQAVGIGWVAQQQLQRARSATVSGRTSGGVFLRLDTAWVVFLSWDGPPGPLTIQLPFTLGEDITPGVPIQVGPESLHFPAPLGGLDLRVVEIWGAPAAHAGPEGLLQPVERAARLLQMSHLAMARRPGAGWSALLPGLDVRLEALAGLPQVVRPALDRLRAVLAQGEVEAAVLALDGLLGLGGGLTPSGDDMALGLLLALRRWGQVLLPQFDREAFIERVVDHARRATSDLSASLIEAAAMGQADPRLIASLDCLVTGWPPVEECAAGLAEWGNSSGLDALLGMSLVV